MIEIPCKLFKKFDKNESLIDPWQLPEGFFDKAGNIIQHKNYLLVVVPHSDYQKGDKTNFSIMKLCVKGPEKKWLFDEKSISLLPVKEGGLSSVGKVEGRNTIHFSIENGILRELK